jgi:hypothetical protein
MPDSSARPVDSRTRRVLLRAIPLSLIAPIVALLLFAWMAEEVLESGTLHFDDNVRAAAHQYASPALTVFMRGITLLGSMEVLLPAVLIVLTVLLVRGKTLRSDCAVGDYGWRSDSEYSCEIEFSSCPAGSILRPCYPCVLCFSQRTCTACTVFLRGDGTDLI